MEGNLVWVFDYCLLGGHNRGALFGGLHVFDDGVGGGGLAQNCGSGLYCTLVPRSLVWPTPPCRS